METKLYSYSPKETELIGEKLGKLINYSLVVAFKGGLGAGKTCFTRGLAKGIGYLGDVTSPTFNIVNEYLGGRLPIYHFDMYRISDEDELYSIGFYDYLDVPSVCIIEWSENIASALPDDTLFITVESPSDNEREFTFSCGDDKILKEL